MFKPHIDSLNNNQPIDLFKKHQTEEYGAEIEHDLGLNVLQRMIQKDLKSRNVMNLNAWLINVSLDLF